MDPAPSTPSPADEPDSVARRAARLANYIRTLPDFVLVERQAAHGHRGATLAEATLQAGMRYHAQVVPRVAHILETYPEATTSAAFLAALEQDTPEAVIDIHGRKAKYTYALTNLLATQGVQTEAQLRVWLEDPGQCAAAPQSQGGRRQDGQLPQTAGRQPRRRRRGYAHASLLERGRRHR